MSQKVMKPITLSLNPSYLCNFRCDFCYLSKEQLSDTKLMSFEKLQGILEDISNRREIIHIDLYGGEPSMLPKSYFMNLYMELIQYVEYLHINTNGFTIRDYMLDEYFKLCISYDFEAREESEKVFRNMQYLSSIHKPFSVIILASPKVLEMNPDTLVKKLSTLSGLTSIEVKPYSSNQSNQHNVTHKQHENFVIRVIEACRKYGIESTNLGQIKSVLDGYGHAYSDEHLYITPTGLAVLDFDLNDNEFFLALDSFEEYERWTEKEKRVVKDSFCGQCEFYGKCLSEHLRYVENLDNSCSGHYYLLQHFK